MSQHPDIPQKICNSHSRVCYKLTRRVTRCLMVCVLIAVRANELFAQANSGAGGSLGRVATTESVATNHNSGVVTSNWFSPTIVVPGAVTVDWITPTAASGDVSQSNEAPAVQNGRVISSNWFSPTAESPGVVAVDWGQPGEVYSEISRPIESPASLPVSFEGRFDGPYSLQLFPAGLMYRSYVAGEREPRISGVWLTEKNRGLVLETALGGRAGLLRYGTQGPFQPQGFQLDLEGAGLARVDPEENSDLEGADFRFGLVGTWQFNPWAFKAGYYHISSHIGDEFLLRTGSTTRRNYVRDALVFGARYDYSDYVNLYGEVAYAPNHNGGAEPLELQFGAEYNPIFPTGFHGSPVLAINGHLREEFDFGGSVNVVWGWQWKGETGSAFRVGMQYYNGPSIQWSFFDQHEEFVGAGMWYDF